MNELDAKGEPKAPEDRIGATLDRYTIVRLLGRGGMGAVYEARHAKIARRFAIKFLLPEFAANRDVLRRFENEAKAAGGLEHPNLAAVIDVGKSADGAPYIVMEFLQGEDSAKVLRSNGPLAVRRAADIVIQACRGLAVAHRAGIVHRDLKPENIFIAEAGNGGDHVKVLDFGIAKLRATDASVATGTGATFGTAFYMSPEQARGAGEVDQRSDVWSLGVVLYELLSGRRPFEGETFLEVVHKIVSVEPPSLAAARPGLPPKLVALVHQAMAKELLDRIPSVTALADALAPYAVLAAPELAWGLGATAPTPETLASPSTHAPPSPPEPLAPSSAKMLAPASNPASPRTGRRLKPVVVATALTCLLAGLAWAFSTLRHSAPAKPQTAMSGPAEPAHPPPVNSLGTLPVHPPVLPSTATQPQLEAPARVHPSPAPAPASAHVREHRSNTHEPSPIVQQPTPSAVPAPARRAPPDPKPAQTSESTRAGHPIDIEKDNPYGN